MAKGATVGARALKTRLTTLERRLRRLEAEGLVSRPTRGGLGRLRAVRSTGASMALAVAEDREDRFWRGPRD
jgi:hypothetical protein